MPEVEKVIMVFGLQVLLLNLQVELDVAAALYMDVVDAAAGHAMDAAAAGHAAGEGGKAAGGSKGAAGERRKGVKRKAHASPPAFKIKPRNVSPALVVLSSAVE